MYYTGDRTKWIHTKRGPTVVISKVHKTYLEIKGIRNQKIGIENLLKSDQNIFQNTVKLRALTRVYNEKIFFFPKCHSISLSKWSNYPNRIREKNQTPWTIRYFGDLAKFSQILQENIISHLFFFLKIWQRLTLCSGQCKRLTIARCKIKWLCSDKILFSWSIRENLAKSPK